ncbi:RNA methyltransferase, TrmA family [hydrothermal vent metagenome]|uniref:RNA methyltransferase, TrmA family n=1 Tax=hydrothermal vent metagenome TaxID=652676 RepID=A0A1W1EKN6_9ZZZZ
MQDSKEYLDKKSFFDKMLTIYGRNAVLEALEDKNISIYRLHLSSSNKDAEVISKIKNLANSRDIEIKYHTKESLSRVSKNAKQDQGVALDIELQYSNSEIEFMKDNSNYRLIALDRVQNPQNLGMIIRSITAGNIDGLILEDKNSAKISPLVIKASAGTLFKIPIIKTKSLYKTLKAFQNSNADIYTLSPNAKINYKEQQYGDKTIFILGNESDGVSKEIEGISDKLIKIDMNRGVESLNVAVTASLLAFL